MAIHAGPWFKSMDRSVNNAPRFTMLQLHSKSSSERSIGSNHK